MRVLEIGSGWGGFALYAAGELGCDVTSITVSQAQHELATERIAEAGLADRARVELRDYREIQGEYDAIVSIEMLEAVGAEYFEAFFAACDRALKPGGRMSLQSICFPDVAYEPQRRGVELDPALHLPGRAAALAGRRSSGRCTARACSSTGAQDIREHYVTTLATWRHELPRAARPRCARMGFDERFIRMWEYYLALSQAGFATGLVQDQQIVLEKSRGI